MMKVGRMWLAALGPSARPWQGRNGQSGLIRRVPAGARRILNASRIPPCQLGFRFCSCLVSPGLPVFLVFLYLCFLCILFVVWDGLSNHFLRCVSYFLVSWELFFVIVRCPGDTFWDILVSWRGLWTCLVYFGVVGDLFVNFGTNFG